MSNATYCDPAETSLASYEHHPVDDIEPRAELAADGLAMVERVLLFLSETRQVGFQLDCLLLITGAGYRDGLTEQDIALKYGVTKQAVSKRCVELCTQLEIKPGPGMRSEESKLSFVLANRRNLPALCPT